MSIITRELDCKLSAEEIAAYAVEQNNLMFQVNQLEEDRKDINSDIKDKNERIDKLIPVIRTGREKKLVSCEWHYDWDRGIKTLYRLKGLNVDAGKHGFSGACAPGQTGRWNGGCGQSTFSLGIFEWIPKSGGAGVKKGPVKVRVIGYVSAADAVRRVAEKIVAELDAGTYSGKKTVRVGTA